MLMDNVAKKLSIFTSGTEAQHVHAIAEDTLCDGQGLRRSVCDKASHSIPEYCAILLRLCRVEPDYDLLIKSIFPRVVETSVTVPPV